MSYSPVNTVVSTFYGKAELQTRGSIVDNSEIIFLYSQ